MAPNFLALATTLENLGARRLLAKKVNFVPCSYHASFCTVDILPMDIGFFVLFIIVWVLSMYVASK